MYTVPCWGKHLECLVGCGKGATIDSAEHENPTVDACDSVHLMQFKQTENVCAAAEYNNLFTGYLAEVRN